MVTPKRWYGVMVRAGTYRVKRGAWPDRGCARAASDWQAQIADRRPWYTAFCSSLVGRAELAVEVSEIRIMNGGRNQYE